MPRTDEPKPTRTYTLTEDEVPVLEGMAERRFGGNRSRALRWAVRMAAVVLDDPSTFGLIDPVEALEAYVSAKAPS